MQISNFQIALFDVQDGGIFEEVGELGKYKSIIWPDKYCGYSEMELWAPIITQNKDLLKRDRIIWCGGENACIIEIMQSEVDDDGFKNYNIKGRSLEKFLCDRIIKGTYTANNKNVSTVLYEVVTQHCVSPEDTKRKIPFLECATDTSLGPKITVQQTGGTVYDFVEKIASTYDLGFKVIFKPRDKKMVFTVYEGVDRTSGQTINDAVVFSTETEDLLTSTYYSNNQDEKLVAWVQGEGEGSARTSIDVGDTTLSGFKLKELYVDARDLQSTVNGDNGEEEQIPEDEYKEMLNQRGLDKLAECVTTENFEAQVRVFGGTQYHYGEEFKLGDKVTIEDTQLGVMIDARITEVEEDYSDTYALHLTFGYGYPTLMQRVKQQTS